jgi:Tfp pilus assembly protein PilV
MFDLKNKAPTFQYKYKLSLNSQGMSLPGVMVAAAIGSIIMLSMTSLITDIFKSQRTINKGVG